MDALILTGFIGCIAAILVGIGEFFLQNTIEKNALDVSSSILNKPKNYLKGGYFIVVLIAPFYSLGFWHLYKMLAPNTIIMPAVIVFLAVYSFIVQLAWSSLKTVFSLILQVQIATKDLSRVIRVYQSYDKAFLAITRFILQVLSVFFIYLVWHGNTYYPKWMVIFNPVVILIGIFTLYVILPKVGKYLIPIALHVMYAIFFAISTYLSFVS
ncbi:Uncharacterised protein [Legionella busanensis]|uniref:Uncharacterized protein n=1 Tax=Legionella busanensis TaxID=190655 RepID=A0A378JII3_9GAMM|nr:DUF6796 family protein [Legionella busanensis]STX50857.1 Uncharacterised protein [Legionella busanensis]